MEYTMSRLCAASGSNKNYYDPSPTAQALDFDSMEVKCLTSKCLNNTVAALSSEPINKVTQQYCDV